MPNRRWHDITFISGDHYLVEWSADCNGDGIVDYGQILDGTLTDSNGDFTPDICEEVVAWGSNVQNQSDVPVGLTEVSKVSGGEYHSMALLVDGTVICWGGNQYGQCDVPEELGPVVDIDGGD